MKSKNRWLSFIGPGLLYAGAAIGVSHLVQSTRAGALFGFQLLGIVFCVNLLKYPFFETGSKYSGITGKSLIYAYHKISPKVLWFYLIQTFVTMFIIQAAVTIVATGLLKTLTNWQIANWKVASIISISCLLILFIGQYKLLKNFTKWVVITLAVCTLAAVLLAINNPVNAIKNQTIFSIDDAKNLAFLVALMGWMPAPLDISVWQSVWRVDGKEEVNVKKALIDFHVGYWGTALISMAFLSLGALIFFNSGKALTQGGAAFSAQLVALYTTAIGQWAWPIVAFAAFATMFTTCLTCLDANPRVILKTTQQLGFNTKKGLYFSLMLLSAFAAVAIPYFTSQSMTQMVDFATTVSFCTAPIFATLNHKINNSKKLKEESPPGLMHKIISYLGLFFLYGFALYYVYTLIN